MSSFAVVPCCIPTGSNGGLDCSHDIETKLPTTSAVDTEVVSMVRQSGGTEAGSQV